MGAPSKFYSSRQEKMVAEYLGWRVVSGSGARAFNPGDVCDDNYLGECKTSEVVIERVPIMRSHWLKICDEAMGVHKIPVLFIDDGSQKSQNTLCVVRFDGMATKTLPKSAEYKRSAQRASFNIIEAINFAKSNHGKFYIQAFDIELLVYTLSAFKEYIDNNRW